MKRFLSLLLSIVMVFSCLSCLSITSVNSATNESPNYSTRVISYSDLVNRLEVLKNKYVGTYWTTNGAAANSSGSTSKYYYGIQCNGFAKYIFNDLFCSGNIGAYDENKYYFPTPNGATLIDKAWSFSSTDTTTVKSILSRSSVGDIIQVRRRGKTYGHTMIIGGVDSSGIWIFDCNSDGKCGVKYYYQTWAIFAEKNIGMSLYHSIYYPSQEPPTNPTISKNQVWYDIKDTIEIYAYADNATSYYMSMFKDGNRIKGEGVENGVFTMSASDYGIGDYSAYFSCSNSLGTVDTQWIEFSVVGEPSYSDVYTSNWWYDLTDTVSISVDTICAKGQVIGIDKVGTGRIITEQCDSTFTIPASKLGVGEYSAYFSVYNGSGGIDTKHVTFGIVDKPKDDAIVNSSKTSYNLDDTVEISVLAYCTKGQVIGIDKIGVGRVVTENCGTTYTIPASQLGRGKFSAYFSIYNGSGGYDTERVEFAIDNPLSNPQISIDRKEFDINDVINIKASANGGVNEYTLKIYDANSNEIQSNSFTGHNITINADTLGVGKYTAKVICSNYAFDLDTDEISFEIRDHKICSWDISEITKNPTCTTDGIKTYTCSTCGDTYTETIPATGHTVVVDEAIPPSLTQSGLTEGKHCSVCNEVFVQQEIIPTLKLGDIDGDGIVSIMDATLIQLHLSKTIALNADQLIVANTDGDSEITIMDVTRIQLFLAKVIEEF